MARRNPNSSVFTNTVVLTEDQQQAIADLKAEREVYQKQLQQARRKRNKIKKILDNFEAVVIGDVLVDILPDENSDEIINSIIITKIDALNTLNGVDITEIMETVTTQEYVTDAFGTTRLQNVTTQQGTGVTVSGFSSSDVNDAKGILSDIFNNSTVKELIDLSPTLNDEELYAPIYYQKINESNRSSEGKELLESIIKDIEIKSSEPPVSYSVSK